VAPMRRAAVIAAIGLARRWRADIAIVPARGRRRPERVALELPCRRRAATTPIAVVAAVHGIGTAAELHRLPRCAAGIPLPRGRRCAAPNVATVTLERCRIAIEFVRPALMPRACAVPIAIATTLAAVTVIPIAISAILPTAAVPTRHCRAVMRLGRVGGHLRHHRAR